MTNIPLSGEELKAAVERLPFLSVLLWNLGRGKEHIFQPSDLAAIQQELAALSSRPAPSGDVLTDTMLAEAFAKTMEYELPEDELDYANAPDDVKAHFRRAAEYLNARQALAAHQPTLAVKESNGE